MDENVLLKTEMELDFKKYEANSLRIKNMSRDEAIRKLLELAHALTLITAITAGRIGIEICRVEPVEKPPDESGTLDDGCAFGVESESCPICAKDIHKSLWATHIKRCRRDFLSRTSALNDEKTAGGQGGVL